MLRLGRYIFKPKNPAINGKELCDKCEEKEFNYYVFSVDDDEYEVKICRDCKENVEADFYG
jgi:hypothetical protein